jgi:PAS domain S-box-containing protein
MQEHSSSKILVVEDDPRLSESVRYLLDAQGYIVHTSNTLDNALESLQSQKYDLILLDLQLFDQSGFSVMDYLATKDLDTQIIVVSGQESVSNPIQALKKGAADYLKKPFEPDDLFKSVDKILSFQKQQREHHQRNNSIESSRDRFRQVVDGQNDYLCCLNTKLEITFANKSLAGLFKTTPREMIGKSYQSYVKIPIEPTLETVLKELQSGAISVDSEYAHPNRKGESVYQKWRFQRILDVNGKVTEIQCVGHDVTQEKIIQNKIEEKKEKYRHLAEITSDWIWEVDKDGYYTYSSPVVYDLLGYYPEEIIGIKPFDLMIEEDARTLTNVFQNAQVEGRPLQNIENINVHKDGSPVILETNGIPIFDQSETVIGYRGIDRNITARKLAEERFKEESRKLKEALEEVKRLSGLLPICAECKMIRNDEGYWTKIEEYIESHSEAEFTHGICPKCAKKLYPELYKEKKGY